jgi:cathepsin A (carboxypeptidase C)
MFYWFFPSQSDAVNDPLVLFLNGGPGCSSMIGLFMENGRFTFSLQDLDPGYKVTENPFAWSKKANVLYIDNPVGYAFIFLIF